MKDKNKKKINIPDLKRLLFIHDKILTELNYLCMIDNLKNNLPIGIIYNGCFIMNDPFLFFHFISFLTTFFKKN